MFDRPHTQPNRASTSRQDQQIVRSFEQNPGVSLRQGAEHLRKRNIHVSYATIQRKLHKHQLKSRSTVHKPLLTDDHIEKRIRWATENLHTDWSKIIYTAEYTFWLSNILAHTGCRRGNRTVMRTVKHPQKLHVYGAFCERGFGTFIIFTGVLNTERMCNLYRRTLLTTANKFYGTGNRDWQLLENNDSIHKSRRCTEWKDQHGINQMEWLPQAPDCNPTENVWAILDARLKSKSFRNLKQLGAFVKRQWSSFSPKYAEDLSKSMLSRCSRVIVKQGKWIEN